MNIEKETIVNYVDKQNELISAMKFVANATSKFEDMNISEINDLVAVISSNIDSMEVALEELQK